MRPVGQLWFQSLHAELVAIHPFHRNQRPEIEGKTILHIIVRQPAITGIAPGRAPGIPDQECASRFLVASGIPDLDVIVITYRDNGMPPLRLFVRARVRMPPLTSTLSKEANPQNPNIEGIPAAR